MKEPAKNPWFFHENGRFIEFLELARTGGVLQFAIFQRTRTGTNSITRTTFIHMLSLKFSCKEPAGSWILKSGEILEKLC